MASVKGRKDRAEEGAVARREREARKINMEGERRAIEEQDGE